MKKLIFLLIISEIFCSTYGSEVPRKASQACDKIKNLNLGDASIHESRDFRDEVVKPGDFPHHVSIQYESKRDNTKTHHGCSGTLISKVRNFIWG